MHKIKRSIRLKEYARSTSAEYMPGEAYVHERDGALENKSYLLETDAQGFIKGPDSPDQAEYSIVILGDSVVESLFLDPEERFCARLEAILRNDYGIDVAVRNGGYGGATTLHAFNIFINKVVPMKPTLVILMSGIADVGVASLRSGYWSSDCWVTPFVELGQDDEFRDQDRLPAPSFVDRRRLLDLFSTAARSFGIELWFATVPHQQRTHPDPCDLRARLDMNEVTRAAARAGGHVLCDLEAQLADRHDIFHDMYHLNRGGGEAVARAFIKSGLALWLGPQAPRSNGTVPGSGLLGDIHVINLDRSTQRWAKFRERNAHLDQVRRFSAVDGSTLDRPELEREKVITADLDYSNGTLGCALSHIRLWQKVVVEDVSLTILEDDAYTHPEFMYYATKVAEGLPDDWDIVLWGYVYDPLFMWIDMGFANATMHFYGRRPPFSWPDTYNGYSVYRSVKLNHVFGFQAYSVSPRGARRLLATALPLRKRMIEFPGAGVVTPDLGIDVLASGIYPTMQSFCCVPPLVVQRDDGISDRESVPG